MSLIKEGGIFGKLKTQSLFGKNAERGTFVPPMKNGANSGTLLDSRANFETVSPTDMSTFVRNLSLDLLNLHVNNTFNKGTRGSSIPLKQDCWVSVYGTPVDGIEILNMPVTDPVISIHIPPNKKDKFNALNNLAKAGRNQIINELADHIDSMRMSFVHENGDFVEYAITRTGDRNWHCAVFDNRLILDWHHTVIDRTVTYGTSPYDPEIDFQLNSSHFGTIQATAESMLKAFRVLD